MKVVMDRAKEIKQHEYKGFVHCPMCTHTVESQVIVSKGESAYVKPGEHCPRCNSALDAGYVLQIQQAA